jgi:hypothetical protein
MNLDLYHKFLDMSIIPAELNLIEVSCWLNPAKVAKD